MIIYITGIDGSGKSTIADKLAKDILRDKKTIYLWARYQPKIVKFLISPFKRNYVSDPANDHIMNAAQLTRWLIFKKKITKSYLVSKITYLIQSVDYYLQLKKVVKKIEDNKDNNIIIDRMYLDFIVDQSINYGDISDRYFTKIFLNRLEKLDYIFYIDVDDEIALRRKADIPSLEYLKGKRKYYKQYIEMLDNAYIIKNNNNISDTMKEIQHLLEA